MQPQVDQIRGVTDGFGQGKEDTLRTEKQPREFLMPNGIVTVTFVCYLENVG